METEVIKIVRKTCNEWSIKINTDTDLFEDLNFDDLDFVELLMDLEVKFNIHIPDNDYEKCKTISDIIKLVNKII